MSIITDYGLDLPSRAYLIMALAVDDKNRKKSSDKLHIQKIIRYFEYLRQSKEIDFSNFHYGGVSYELEENLETLEESGLVKIEADRVELTPDGHKAADVLKQKFDPQDLSKLTFAKQQLNDLTPDELMFLMYKLLPETQEHSTEAARLLKKSQELVESLYAKKRITVAQVASWLGISESDFLASHALGIGAVSIRSGHAVRNRVTEGGWKFFAIQVPPKAKVLSVTMKGEPDDNLDLFVFPPKAKKLSEYRAAPKTPLSIEGASIKNPEPGTWRIGVFGSSVKRGTFQVLVDTEGTGFVSKGLDVLW
jgi:hypothetical protein